VPLQNPFSPATVSDHTSPEGFEPRLADTRVSAAPPETGFTTARTPRHIDNSITAAPQAAGSTTGMRHRPLEPSVPMNKNTADGRASIQGFVKDAKGEPIKGAGVRIESRDGKQVFGTVKTDPKGRYISQGLQPGAYRITLLVNGTVKASILDTETKANQPTQ